MTKILDSGFASSPIFERGDDPSRVEQTTKDIAVIDIDNVARIWFQAFLFFFISSLVLHLGQALGLFTLVSHP
jgi:hypothetical protein